jgi:hypothetical protein
LHEQISVKSAEIKKRFHRRAVIEIFLIILGTTNFFLNHKRPYKVLVPM